MAINKAGQIDYRVLIGSITYVLENFCAVSLVFSPVSHVSPDSC